VSDQRGLFRRLRERDLHSRLNRFRCESRLVQSRYHQVPPLHQSRITRRPATSLPPDSTVDDFYQCCSWLPCLVATRLMAAPGTWEVLRFCFFGDGRRSPADCVAVLSVWCLTLAILLFNAFFRLLLKDGNLLIRGVGTLILAAPLLYLYARAKRSVLDRRTA